jgi:hypothetical protein
MKRTSTWALPLLIAASLGLGGCSLELGGGGSSRQIQVAATSPAREPVLLSDGTCESDATLFPAGPRSSASEIALGVSECDLVRLKGAKPDDVLIGQGGTGQREVQVLYAEPGGRELYLFTDNKLTKIVKPGQG